MSSPSTNYTVTTPNANEFRQLLTIWEDSVRAAHHFLSDEKFIFLKRRS